jgi:hypothetical protein
MVETLEREQAMYTALVDSARRALETTFNHLDDGETLVEAAAEAKTEKSAEHNFGWDCNIVAPNELKAFSLGIVQGLDKLAEQWEVKAHPAYIAAKDETVTHIMNIGNCEAATVKQIEESLNFMRSMIMKLKVQINSDNAGMLSDISRDFVKDYEAAAADPTIAEDYDALRQAVLNTTTTSSALRVLLERFMADLPEFQSSSRAFLNEMVGDMYNQAVHFGIEQSPKLLTFFEEVALQLSVATRPVEFMAIGRLLEELEPLLTEKIVMSCDIDKVRGFVTGLFENIQGAYDNGVPLSENAEVVLQKCDLDLAQASDSRDDYLSVLQSMRTVTLAS